MPDNNHSIFLPFRLFSNNSDINCGLKSRESDQQSLKLNTRFADLRKTYLTIQATCSSVAFRTGMKLAGRGVTTSVTILLTLLTKKKNKHQTS